MTTAASLSDKDISPHSGDQPEQVQDSKIVEIAGRATRRQAQHTENHVEAIVSGATFRDMEPGSRRWEEALVASLAEKLSPTELSALQGLAVLRQAFVNEAVLFVCRRASAMANGAAFALRNKLTGMQILRAGMSAEGNAEYKLHATVARAIVNIMDESSRRKAHEIAAEWHAKPYSDRMEEAMPAILEKTAGYWRDKRLEIFEGATLEEWQDSRSEIPPRHVEKLRRACMMEYLTAAVTRGDKSAIVWNVENTLELQFHLRESGRQEEAAGLETLLLEPLERWGRLEEVCEILKGRAAGQTGAERIATLERVTANLQKLQRWDEALPLAREIHAHYARLQDRTLEIKSLQRLRDLWRHKGAIEEALEAQKKVLALEDKRENIEGRMHAHQEMSVLYMMRGRTGNVKQSILSRFQIYLTFLHSDSDLAQSVIHSRKAESLAKRLGDTQARAKALHQRGRVMDYFGNNAAAEKYYLKAMELRRQIADEEGMADSLQEIGKTYLATAHALLVQGKQGPAHVFFNKAQRCFFDSVEIYRAINKQDRVKVVTELMESTVIALSR